MAVADPVASWSGPELSSASSYLGGYEPPQEGEQENSSSGTRGPPEAARKATVRAALNAGKPLGPRKREHVDEVPNSCGGLTGVLTGSWQTPGVWGGSEGPLQPAFPDGSEAVFANHRAEKPVCRLRKSPVETVNRGWRALGQDTEITGRQLVRCNKVLSGRAYLSH